MELWIGSKEAHLVEEFKKDYMELVKESLTTENRTQLIKSAKNLQMK